MFSWSLLSGGVRVGILGAFLGVLFVALLPEEGKDPGLEVALESLRLRGVEAVETGDRASFVQEAEALVDSLASRIRGVRLLAGQGLVVEQVPGDLEFEGEEGLQTVELPKGLRFEALLRPRPSTWWRRAAHAAAGALAVFLAFLVWLKTRVRRPLDLIRRMIPRLGEDHAQIDFPEMSLLEIEELAREIKGLAAHFVERNRTSQANYLALEMAFEKIRAVLHSLGEGVLVTDRGGEVVLANPSASMILGSETSDLKGRPVCDLFPRESREDLQEAISRARRGGRTEFVDGVVIEDRHFHVSIAPIKDTGIGGNEVGEEGGVAIVLLDITASVEISRMKDEFLSSVSHELRTPLTSIRSYTEILLHMTPEDEDTWKEFLGIVSTEAERLTRLVNEILDLARMEAGKMEFNFGPVDVEHALRTLGAVFDPLLKEKKGELVLDLPEKLPPVHADRDRLHQVLTNLVGNACKFLPEKGTVKLSVEVRDEEVFFRVEDSGPGIPEEERRRIFEKFQQVGDSLTEKPKGTGLGLPICREILDKMGGRIWCGASGELGGASFHFTLPVSRESHPTW